MVSIIVPAYNAEKTIEKCVASILAQKGVDKQIVLVNDGSKDGTWEVLRRLKVSHSEIIVIDKPNGGVSSARNAGRKVCTGKYVTFIDSDDYYLSDTYIFDMVRCMDEDPGVGLVVSGYTVLTGQQQIEHSPQAGVHDTREFVKTFWSDGNRQFMTSPWNKLFRAELIKNTFCEQMKMGEDAVFVYQYLKNCRQIVFCDGCGYGYVYENTSSTADFRKNAPYDMQQSKIYHEVLHDLWVSFLPKELVAENYMKMRMDEVLLMMRSLLRKKGLLAYLQRDITEVIADARFNEYYGQVKIASQADPHKKLAKAIVRTNTVGVKAYCLYSMVKNKLIAITKGQRKKRML